MKNKYFTFVALAAAALATSCASDDLANQKQEQNPNEPHTVALTASVNEGQTRVGMAKGEDNTASFYWHKGDQILVQTKTGESYTGTAFSITEDDAKDGDTKATFTGEVTGTVGTYAVYPYNESHSFTGETALTYNLPASYTYTSVESNIFSKTTDGTTAYPSNPTNMPMLGKISDGNISFKCLGGLAVIRIDKMPATSGTLTVTADQQLSGNFTISDLSVNEPKIETTTASDDNGKVTFTFSGASTESAGVFYLPLATGSYSGVKITVASMDNSTTSTVDYGSVSVSRAGVTAIPLYNNNGTIGKDIDKSCTIGGHWFVDLGLPSGLLWAETNVGATNSYDFGNYYLSGEATGAARSWSSSCSLPTKDNFEELISNCSWTWVTENGVNGYKVTGKKDGYTGNSIFLPAAGYGEYYMDFDMSTGGIVYKYPAYDENQKGYYWSTSTAQSLVFNSSSYNVGDIYSYNKARVRPVAN